MAAAGGTDLSKELADFEREMAAFDAPAAEVRSQTHPLGGTTL